MLPIYRTRLYLTPYSVKNRKHSHPNYAFSLNTLNPNSIRYIRIILLYMRYKNLENEFCIVHFQAAFATFTWVSSREKIVVPT